MVSLVGKVSGVNVPLGGRFLKPATPLVSEGDEVAFAQKIGEPVDEGFSIGVWSSMDGTVSSIEDEVVAISGGEAFKRKQRQKQKQRRLGSSGFASAWAGALRPGPSRLCPLQGWLSAPGGQASPRGCG